MASNLQEIPLRQIDGSDTTLGAFAGYTGYAAGFQVVGSLAVAFVVAGAVGDPLTARFAGDVVEDTLDAADLRAARHPAPFAAQALRRFANPALGHTCAQVGADGSSKLPQRLLPVVAARETRSLGTSKFALVAAIWLAAAGGGSVDQALED